MDDAEKLNETSLTEEEHIYIHLKMKDITRADCAHVKGVCKDFAKKNLGEYHDLYVQNDILLLVDIFDNFGNICLEIYELDPAKLISAPELA